MWLLILLAVSAAPPAAERFEVLAHRAEQARAAAQNAQAIQLYRQALQLKPSWTEGNWALASLLYQTNDYPGACKALDRLIAAVPNSGAAYMLRGLSEFEERDFAAALLDLRRGSTLGIANDPPLESSAREHLIALLTRAGEFDEAAAELTRAIQAGGSREIFGVLAGLIALHKPMFASQVPPQDQELVSLAGAAMFEALARHPEQAKEAFSTLVVRYPNAEYVHYLYGSFLLTSSPDAGRNELKTELAHFPQDELARLQLIFDYLKSDDVAAALPLAETAVEQQPSSYKAHHALGRCLIASGQLDRGIRELELSRKLQPNSPQTRLALASAYAKAGRKAEADRERAEFLRLRRSLDGQTPGEEASVPARPQ